VLRHKSEYRNSFLTIDNYKFTREDIEKYIKSGKDAKVLEDVVLRVISKKFQEQLKAFVELYSTLDTMTVDKKYFVPVCLDLFNRNRSITSMTNDPNLYKRVENIIKQGNDFIQRNETQIRCTRFIDFIIRFNYFPIDDLDLHRDKVEELFVQKRPYQKIEDIFPRFKKSQTSFKDYLNDQESSFDKINEVFRFI
jgi:hypothetical protein